LIRISFAIPAAAVELWATFSVTSPIPVDAWATLVAISLMVKSLIHKGGEDIEGKPV